MRMLVRVATAAALSAVVAVPASAQFWRADIGINGGGTWWSNLMSSGDDVFDVNGNQQALGESLHFGDRIGWITGAQATLWITNRFGIRANATYSDAPLEITSGRISDDINLWSGSGDLLYRFVRGPHEEWQGFEVLPYIAAGAGAKWINPAGHGANCFDSGAVGDSESCLPFLVDLDGVTPGILALNKSTRFMGLIGLGTDLRFARHWSARIEVDDRIYKPEIFAFDNCVGAPPFDCIDRFDGNVSKTVHEVSATAGIHY
ncbi:MAG: outer membrane beta-barrel protein, partial [Longimicrobiales bacterium]